MPLPDLRALEAFDAVCTAGSMALAAERLGISASAVSQKIQALERGHGVQLFDREARPARLTAAGRDLQQQAAALLAQARAVAEQLHSGARGTRAQVRLGCVDSFAATVGATLVRALSGSARDLQLWSGLTPGLLAQFIGREIDLAICTATMPEAPRISQGRLLREQWVLVLPRQARPKPISAIQNLTARTQGLPLVRYSARSTIGQQLERYLRHAGLQLPRRFEFDATDPMLSLVAAGLGWALSSPLCLWQSRAWLDQVTVLPLPQTALGHRDLHLISRPDECAGLDDEVARLTLGAVRRETLPALRKAMPALPADIIDCPAPGNP